MVVLGKSGWHFARTNPKWVARPADPFYIAVYFNYLLNEQGTKGSITDAMYGIRWGHNSAGFLSPTVHPFVKMAYEGAKRLSNYAGSNKKDAFTANMIHTLFDSYAQIDNYMYQRFLIICLLGL